MKRLAFLLPALIFVAWIGLAATEARADFVPCCDGGLQPNKRCDVDSDCPNACEGGARTGKVCRSDANCPAACIGGERDGKKCVSDADCPAGGRCGTVGLCNPSTCTGLCRTGRPKESPSDPVARWLELPVAELELQMPNPRTGP